MQQLEFIVNVTHDYRKDKHNNTGLFIESSPLKQNSFQYFDWVSKVPY